MTFSVHRDFPSSAMHFRTDELDEDSRGKQRPRWRRHAVAVAARGSAAVVVVGAVQLPGAAACVEPCDAPEEEHHRD